LPADRSPPSGAEVKMSVAVPLLRLYSFIVWTGPALPLDPCVPQVSVKLTVAQSVKYTQARKLQVL
jgi:hypothetical protein